MLTCITEKLEPDLFKIYNKLIEYGWESVSNTRLIFEKIFYDDFNVKITIIRGRRKFHCRIDWLFSKLLFFREDSRLCEFHRSDKINWFRSIGQLERTEMSIDKFDNLDEILDEMFDNIQGVHCINKAKQLRLFNENI